MAKGWGMFSIRTRGNIRGESSKEEGGGGKAILQVRGR